MEAGGVEVEEGVMRVLLVDDSPVDRRVAQLLLSSNSCAGSFHGQPPPLALSSYPPAPDSFVIL
jgi:CheY-like chemotaxis protein